MKFFLVLIVTTLVTSEDENCNAACLDNYVPVCGGIENDSINDSTHSNDCTFDLYVCQKKIPSKIAIFVVNFDLIFFFVLQIT